jgi:hypothetical protein
MRITLPAINEQRVVRRFLLFPTIIDNEMRWLENAVIIQRYTGFGSLGWQNYHWNLD